jgi:hypothetical protein
MRGVKKEEGGADEEEGIFIAEEDIEEIETDDDGEEDYKVEKRRPQRKSKTNILRFGEVLSPPTPVRYSCEALTGMIDRGQIDLEPEYQRGVVWNVAKQSAVIDSIFRNCYVPPVLFSIHSHTNEEDDTEELRICVDGKQVSEKESDELGSYKGQ